MAAAKPEVRNCGKCVFFEPYREQNGDRSPEGQCRRYALRPGPHENGQWPDTSVTLWCGEWTDTHPYDRQQVADGALRATKDAQEAMRGVFTRNLGPGGSH